MRIPLGFLGLFSALLGGFFINGGHLGLLWHPGEFVIIFGSAVTIFLISNPIETVKQTGLSLKLLIKPLYTEEKTTQTLQLMTELLVILKNNGNSDLAVHISNPLTSAVFKKYELVLSDNDALNFIVDNFNLLESGGDKLEAHQLEAILEQEIELYHHEQMIPVKAITALTEVMPSFGIIAAVMGMNITMMYIDQEPLIIGEKIGAALYGTLLGIFFAYGIFYPIAYVLTKMADQKRDYLTVILSFIMSVREKHNLFIAAEIARKKVLPAKRISREDLRNKVASISKGQ